MGYFIEHEGIIESVTKNLIRVKIIQTSACAGCHAKNMCSPSDQKMRIIEIPSDGILRYPGDTVLLQGERGYGLLAVWWAFLFPFLLIFSFLIIASFFSLPEGLSGVVALLLLIPYYFILSRFKEALKKKFSFKIVQTLKSQSV